MNEQMQCEIDYCFALNEYINNEELLDFYRQSVLRIDEELFFANKKSKNKIENIETRLTLVGIASEVLMIVLAHIFMSDLEKADLITKGALYLAAGGIVLFPPVAFSSIIRDEKKITLDNLYKLQEELYWCQDIFNQKQSQISDNIYNSDNPDLLWDSAAKLRRVYNEKELL